VTIQAVFFDWGDTLMGYEGVATDDFALARTQLGLAALRRDGLPEPAAIGEWFQRRGPDFFAVDREDEADYLAVLAACFSELGCKLTDDDVLLYAQAALWEGELDVASGGHELLDELRDRSLKIAIVSNTALPWSLLEPAFSRQELIDRVDAIVLSSEVGKRKPHAAIFERALGEVGVSAERTLFVGDRRYQDVLGAKMLGMRTVLARWFRDDVNPDGAEPDFAVDDPLDVLAIVERIDAKG
jgi:putative hydrolase of the HAD superfamily